MAKRKRVYALLNGAGSVLNLGGKTRFNIRLGKQNDANHLGADWRGVGAFMWLGVRHVGR